MIKTPPPNDCTYHQEQLEQVIIQIEKFKKKLQNRESLICNMLSANNNDKLKIAELENKRDVLEYKLKTKNFLNHSNCNISNIGLYNKILTHSIGKCELHKCYLSYGDVRITKRCIEKKCKYFVYEVKNFDD